MNPQEPDQEKDDMNPAEDPAGMESSEEQDAELAQEMEQFDALLDQHLPGQSGPSESRGEILEVPVVAIKEELVLVDVGGKAEATLHINEFPKVDDKPMVNIGDVIKVVQTGRTSDGSPRISYREARSREAEQKIRESMESKTPVKGMVSDNVKGGLMVDIGLMAFMPSSQIDLFKIPDLSTFKGQEVEAYVIEYDERRKRAILSRRELLYERREKEKSEAIKALSEGQQITGKVKNCKEFGVFLDLGSIDGFIPREEVSWDRGTHPKDIVSVGDEVETVVIKVDEAEGKVTLSRKRTSPDPWDGVPSRFEKGQRVKGKVVGMESFGVFVHLEEGITGMVHVSDLSWSSNNGNPKEFVKIGDEVETVLMDINFEKRTISLSIKHTEQNPWQGVEERYPKGQKIKGNVTSMTTYGAFVRLEQFIEGMIHVSEIAWDKHVSHPKEVFEVGKEIEAVVIKCDPENQKIHLSVKQLGESPFDAYLAENPVNSVVMGKVTRFAPFGAFVELTTGVEGLIHISQIDVKRVELPENVLSIDEEVKVKITKVEKRKQKISLSRREAIRDVEKTQVKAYLKKESDKGGGMTFGEAFSNIKDQLDKKD